ncbi:uncharacterized protein [Ambystoma mexicanum]|uniref:uncharacterized protein n=1 Tax=Ambystoma mexicanum TaxID=8296 RepID=UPI0037E9357F
MSALLEVERVSSDMKTVQQSAANSRTMEESLLPPGRSSRVHGHDPDLLYSTESSIDMPPSSFADNLEVAHCQYLVDCRLEQHWQGALEDILSQPTLPSNPYPSLVSAFRKASLRMDLWGQSDADLLNLIFQTPLEPVQEEKYLFGLQGAVGFGLRSAVCAPNAKLLPDALASCALLRNTSWEQRLGPFKVSVTSALHRPGALDPFLDSLEVTEFCSMQGHPGCQLEALQTYARLILTHLSDVQQRPGVKAPVVRIGVSDTWSTRRAQMYPMAFTETLTEALQDGSPVCMEAWRTPQEGGWRFLRLVKHFELHYSEGGAGRWIYFPEHNPLALYWSIFCSPGEAALMAQRSEHFRDPFSRAALQRPLSQINALILQALQAGDLLSTCRLMASRALLTGEKDVLPACWRVLHSMAAQLEHLNAVNSTVQVFLVMEEAEQADPAPLRSEGTVSPKQAAPRSERDGIPELGRLISGFQLSLERTLRHSSALAPCSLWEVVQRKMQVVSGRTTSQASLRALKAVQGMCQTVLQSTLQDLLPLCPEIQATLQRLQTEDPQREQLVIQNPPPAMKPQEPLDARWIAPPSIHRALEGW